ncbi:MAG: ribose-phosphate diphosphokinase [Candidatus Andersenbacteria bacterium]
MAKPTYIITTQSATHLGKALKRALAAQLLQIHRDTFADGEQYYRIDLTKPEQLFDADVICVSATTNDQALLELQRIGTTLSSLGTRRRIFVIPFLGYSTMEKAKRPGEVVTAKTNALLLSSIPHSGQGNTFLFLDLHEPSLIHYFEGQSAFLELSARELLAKATRSLKLKNYVLGSADLGMPGQIEYLAGQLKVPIALISKSRKFSNTAVVACVGNVEGKSVVIYDDMIRSGGSIIQAAQAYKEAGAKNVFVATTHLALTNPEVVQALERSDIQQIIATNSHPMSQAMEIKKSRLFTIIDIAPIVAKSVRKLLS